MEHSLLSSALRGTPTKTPPIWLMRQAGRYQKSYQKIREKYSFWDICQIPEITCSVSCAPIHEFDFDAAIIFSDILAIPHALGQKISFTPQGPKAHFCILNQKDFNQLSCEPAFTSLEYVYTAIQQTREALPAHKDLIGFAGAPFTLSLYMIEGVGTKTFNKAQHIINTNPILYQQIINRLCDEISLHLIHQAQSGVQALQIFDSWASLLDYKTIDLYSIEPLQKIINTIKENIDIPIIVYSSATCLFPEKYSQLNCEAISFPPQTTLPILKQKMNGKKTIQGHFSQHLLAQDFTSFQKELKTYIHNQIFPLHDTPYIFNLGHGVLPYTPEDNVKYLVDSIREETYS